MYLSSLCINKANKFLKEVCYMADEKVTITMVRLLMSCLSLHLNHPKREVNYLVAHFTCQHKEVNVDGMEPEQNEDDSSVEEDDWEPKQMRHKSKRQTQTAVLIMVS